MPAANRFRVKVLVLYRLPFSHATAPLICPGREVVSLFPPTVLCLSPTDGNAAPSFAGSLFETRVPQGASLYTPAISELRKSSARTPSSDPSRADSTRCTSTRLTVDLGTPFPTKKR